MSSIELGFKLVGKVVASGVVTVFLLIILRLVEDLHRWLFPKHDNPAAEFISASKQWAHKACFVIYLGGEVYNNLAGESNGLPDL